MEISDSSGVPSDVPRKWSQMQFSLRRRLDLIAGHVKLLSIKGRTACEAPGMLSRLHIPCNTMLQKSERLSISFEISSNLRSFVTFAQILITAYFGVLPFSLLHKRL